MPKIFALALLTACVATSAQAGNYYDSGSYNGFGASTQNTPSNYSLRDANGNLTMVDGQFVPSNYSSTSGQSSSATGGVGMSGAGAAYGQASAIGNSLNVVTVGSNNTVIIDSKQTNTGNQTASVALNGN
jgi:holdfast attachment protein HfaA